jgi:hypothetical protein
MQPSLGLRPAFRKEHHTAQRQARFTMAQARWDHLGAALGVAVLGTAVLGVAVLGTAVLGVAVLGTGVLQPGTAHAASIGLHPAFQKEHHTAQWEARFTTAQARWDHLGAALGVAVLGTGVLGVAVLGTGVLQPGTAHAAQPWVAPRFS